MTTDIPVLRAVVVWSDGTTQTSCGALNGGACAVGTSFSQTKLVQQTGVLTYRATFYDVNDRVVATDESGTTSVLPPTSGKVTTCSGISKLGSRCLVSVQTTTDVQGIVIISNPTSAIGVSSRMQLVSTDTFAKRFELRPGVLVETVPRSSYSARLTNVSGQIIDLPFFVDVDAAYPYTVTGMPSGAVISGTKFAVTTTFSAQYNVQMRLVIDDDVGRAINFDQGTVATLDSATLGAGTHSWYIEGYREGILVAERTSGIFSIAAATPSISSITVTPGKVLAGDANGALLALRLSSPVSRLSVAMQRPDCSTYVDLDLLGYSDASQTSYSRRIASANPGIYRLIARAYRADGTFIAAAPNFPVLQFVATAAELTTPQTAADFSACVIGR
jgi:hypothetical protein